MKFERIAAYPNVNLPKRATIGAAGYDFECAVDTICPAHKITLIPTGIKAQIDNGYYLQLAVRSSTPKKKGLVLANGIGIVDEDYYNNPDNEGHIMFQVLNYTDNDVTIPAGERIGQGVFVRYTITDDDITEALRTGGFGSTDITNTFSTIFDTNSLKDQELADFLNDPEETQYMNNRMGIAP